MRDIDKGRTILFVSHNLNAVRTLCNHVLVLKDGRISGFGGTPEMIGKYMEGMNMAGEMSRDWPDDRHAPQNSISRLRKVSLCDASSRPLKEIFTHTNIHIQIEFTIKVPGSTVGMTLIVYDAGGNCVFSSINNNERQWYGKPMPSGRYRMTCLVPGNYFNNGWFSISLNMFGKNFSEAKLENDILRFHIQDSHEIRGDYHGQYSGCVRPYLEWNTQALGVKGEPAS